LTDRYTVSYVPSGTVFTRLREQHRPLRVSSLLALGDPVFKEPARDNPDFVPPPEHGLHMDEVYRDRGGFRAGMRAGDVLVRYNGIPTRNHLEFIEALAKPVADNEKRTFTVWRAGKLHDFSLPEGTRVEVRWGEWPNVAAIRERRDVQALLARVGGSEAPRPLPGTRREVEALAQLFPEARVLVGSDASEQKLDELRADGRLGKFAVLHLATHGAVDEDVADRAALLLARDHLPDAVERRLANRKIYTGRLTVATIRSGWQLDADLVTLSACETALGPDSGGEGFLGFAQALFQTGARSVLLSLWKVDDTATALLMTRFYENLLGKGDRLKAPLGRAEALREAKQWLRELSRKEAESLAAALDKGELRGSVSPLKPLAEPPKEAVGQKGDKPFAHPYYWAAFILLGDPD
jgi:hypothetical protein